MTLPRRHQLRESPADSLAAILNLLPILDAFNHRHRNQHRASRWWASFGLLRRALGRLARCLRPHADAASPPEAVVARARWLGSHIVPAAYLAFSQLAADNQHAPLGLLLLAVLARVHAVIAHLLPSETPLNLPPRQPLKLPASAPESHVDHGVIVSRREPLWPDGPATGRPSPDGSAPTKNIRKGHHDKTVKSESTKAKAKERGKNKHRRDALSSLFSSLA